MALKAAIIITSISIALLVIYGADVAVGGGTEKVSYLLITKQEE